jgi:hypothetical protein
MAPEQFKKEQVALHDPLCRSAGMLPASGETGNRKAGLETGAPSVRFQVPGSNSDVVEPSQASAATAGVDVDAVVREVMEQWRIPPSTP